jgi:hypothetical protein
MIKGTTVGVKVGVVFELGVMVYMLVIDGHCP